VVKEATAKIYKSNGRHSLYIPSDLIGDDRFPLQVGEDLTIRIDGDHLVVEKSKKGKG
jgi:hypothetical protein